MRTTPVTIFYGTSSDKQEVTVCLDSPNELGSDLLAHVREHLGKSISIYRQALAEGVDAKSAQMLLPVFLVDCMNV
jgi:hypothetical protein